VKEVKPEEKQPIIIPLVLE
jgi:hypothetical protein